MTTAEWTVRELPGKQYEVRGRGCTVSFNRHPDVYTGTSGISPNERENLVKAASDALRAHLKLKQAVS